MIDAGVADEIVARRVIFRNDAVGIADMRRDREIEIWMIVDLVDRHQGALEYLATHGLEPVGSPSLRAAVSLAAIAIAAALSLENCAATEQLAATAGLVDISHDMIFMRDPGGAITFWNRAAEDVYGWSAAEALGRQADALLATRYPRPRAEIDAALAAAGRWEGKLVHRTRAGAEIVVESRWALHADRFGTPFHPDAE